MLQEEYNPKNKEINEAVDDAERQMDDFYKSEPSEKPSADQIDAVLRGTAEAAGEKYETCEPAIPEEEIIENHRREGWELVYRVTNRAKTDAYYEEGKETKVVGLGDQFLIFQREKREEE